MKVAILEKTAWVNLNKSVFYYESKGYAIPRIKDKYGRLKVPKGTKIEVKVEDLSVGSHIKLTKICDFCFEPSENKQEYKCIMNSREKTGGKDCCEKCIGIKTWLKREIPEGNSLAEKFPHLIQEWHPTLNNKSPFEVSFGSNNVHWWICPENNEHVYDMMVNKRTSGGRNCPYCAGKRVNHTNCLATIYPEILGEWDYEKNDKNGLTPFDVTFASTAKAWWKCIICKHEWMSAIHNRTSRDKSGCPQCNESKGEKFIRKYLINKNCYFQPQYTFEDLLGIGGNPLKFDFAIFDQNEKLTCLIEYDGEFHFEKQYNQDKFETLQIHDQRKNKYCKDNNITLIRIPYWEFGNLESILDEKLNILFSQGAI